VRANTPKIFGIGLSKTGTTSLAHALEILGYKTRDYPGITQYRASDLSSVDLNMVDAHDALTDTPIPSFYRELDRKYPNSKFILTIRDSEGWLTSCKKQFNEKLAAKQNEAHNQLFMDLYGCTVFDEQKFLDGYEKFVNGVLEHFKDRPQDLLVINVTAGEGWEKLCPFLGRPIPDVPFPKANVTQINWMNIGDIVAIARQAGQASLKARQKFQSGGAIARVVGALRGGADGAMDRARRRAHRQIVDGLAKLNSQIPVLSPESGDVPYIERAKWHHLWLVDPLDGAGAFLAAEGEFTVNIALIQDGAPIYGVVYAPLSDTVYYARVGKGAFKAERAEEPRQLVAPEPARVLGNIASGQDTPSSTSGSRALAMCRAAEGRIGACAWNDPSPEWQTAAPHLVAANAGMRVYDCNSGREPKYNKERLVNECIVVESKESVD